MLSLVVVISYGIYLLLSNASPVILTMLAGGMGFVISKIYESIKENKERSYEKKREIYYKLIKPFREVMIPGKDKKVEISKDQIREAVEAAFDNILYASDDVVKAYGTFRNLSSNGESQPEIILKHFAVLLKAMRKDLGNQFSTLDEVDILKMFINMSQKDEFEYRLAFKKT